MRSGETVLALAGRRPDPAGADVRRFPLDRISAVEGQLRQRLSRPGTRALVCSAAAGTDLLGLRVAGELNLQRRIVLPFAPEEFRETSVIDRPGPWAKVYDRVVDDAACTGDLVVLNGGEGEAAYRQVNHAILAEAVAIARPEGDVRAVIVWEGRPRKGSDLTAAFADSARSRGIPVEELLTIE